MTGTDTKLDTVEYCTFPYLTLPKSSFIKTNQIARKNRGDIGTPGLWDTGTCQAFNKDADPSYLAALLIQTTIFAT